MTCVMTDSHYGAMTRVILATKIDTPYKWRHSYRKLDHKKKGREFDR